MSNTTSNPSGTSTSVPITLTLDPTPSLTVTDENDIRTAILTTLQADYAQQGLTVNVLPGSDYYRLATAIARWGATIEANNVVQVDNYMPDSTQDMTVLARWGAFFGLSPRGATGAYGVFTIACSAPAAVDVGEQLTDSLQQVYQVTRAGTYANGAQVPVQAVSTGAGTDHVNGDTLTWVSAPNYCAPTVTVGTTGAKDGLVNGAPAEDIETFRARVLQAMANPMGGGNWTMVAALGSASSGAVCGTAVYPAANGPSTVHVACWAYATNLAASNAKNRDLPSALMTGTIAPYIQGQLAEYVECVVTTVTNVPVDVAIGLTLPASPSASPAGPGGGWVDGQPWPYNSTGATTFKCTITGLTSYVIVTCDAPSPPIPGVSSIAYLDPSTWTLFTAHVVSYTGTSGAYTLTLDSPLVNLTPGAFIFPQSVNQQTYINALLGAFANMGPGEKTASAGLLPRASRKPTPQTLFPYSLDNTFLKALTNSGTEVIGSSFLYTSAGTAPVAPALPAAISQPPNLYVPRNCGFYPA
jgi:uncharacterized phage protein gp47/JayE